jgi:dethiobiotin synthetase
MRPRRLVVVVGTGTDIGKTWVSARLLATLGQSGVSVAARKPAQSFDPGDDPAGLDSAVLGRASGEPSEVVCLPHRCYEVAMAPPMAADALGRERITTPDLVAELRWPDAQIDVGLIEAAGGVRSPQTHDGDATALVRGLAPHVVLLVADAGLGTINAVRLCVDALVTVEGPELVVVLNRFEETNDVHRRNRAWLREQDGLPVVTLPGDEETLAAIVQGIAGTS